MKRGAFLAVVTILAAALALIAGCGAPIGPMGPSLTVGAELGDATLKTLDGADVQFKQLTSGKVALVDVWATWCGPCIAAMPHLQGLHNQYKGDGFTVIGIMIDRNASSIGPGFMKDNPVNYPILMDDDAASTEKLVGPVSGIPMLVLVGRDGKVLRVFQGFGNPEILSEAVAEALRGTAAPAAAPAA